MTLDIGIDRRVLFVAAGAAAVATFFLGLVSMLQARGFNLRSALQAKDSARHGGNRLRSALVVVEIALSVILLAGAGLFLRTLLHAQSIELGFKPDKVLVLSVDFNAMDYRYDEAKGLAFYHRALECISLLPGIRTATWGGDVPLTLRRLIVAFAKDAAAPALDSDWITVDCNVVGPRYFETLGIPLVKGRDFTARDDESAPGVLVVNETMGRHYWPGEDPVGKWIRLRGRSRELYQIIGVARDIRRRTLWNAPAPYLYFPVYQRYFPEMMLHIRTEGDPMAALPAIRREIEALDNDLPVFDEGPLRSQVDAALAQQRMAVSLLSAAGILSLVLATLGVYGILGYWVLQKRHEIGIRMSLGAGKSSIVGLVLRQGLVLSGCGMMLGLGASLILSRFIRNFLHGVSPTDPFTFIGSILVLGAISLLACLIPSRRAARLDPMAVLRQE